MPSQSWQEVISFESGDGPALATSTAEVSILPGSAKVILPSNYLRYIGQKLRIRASGRVSNIVTTPGTLTFRFKLGPTANIAVAASPAFQLNAVAKTNVTWVLDWAFTIRSVGAVTAATLMHTGQWNSESVVGSPLPSAGGAGTLMIPASGPAVGTGFDSTVANLADLTAQFSISNAANALTLHQYTLESMN